MKDIANHTQKNGSSFSRMVDQMSETLGKIGGFAVLVMVVLVTVNVITRKLLVWTIPGFYEILSLVGAVFYSFGIVYAATKGQHIVMDIVVNRLPRKLQRICGTINRIAVLVFCAVLIYAGVTVTMGMLDEKTDDLGIPVAPFRFVLVSAFVLLALIILAGKDISKGGEE